jgi:hypothetical protein
MVIDVLINGNLVTEPSNITDIKLVVTNEKDVRRVEFEGDLTWGFNDLRDPNDPFALFNQIQLQGTTGGIGVLQAQDLELIARERGRSILLTKSMINLWTAVKDNEKREFAAPIITKGGTDWISAHTEGLTFEFMMAQNAFTKDDFILSPYVIEKQDQLLEKIMVALTAVTIITQLKTQLQEVQEILADAATLSPWVAIAKIALRIIYIASLLVLLANTIAKILNLLIQPVKYICGMTVLKHFQAGFGHLGMTFESSIFQGGEELLTIFPEKYFNPKNKEFDNLKGWIKPDKNKQKGFYKGDFLSFINIFRQYYNAKIIVDEVNKIVKFERRDYVGRVANYTLPDVWSKETLNFEDFKANYLLSFQPDLNDRHTIGEYFGTSSQLGLSIIGSIDPQKSLLDGGKTISMPFSLFKVKTELSDVEVAVKAMLETIDFSLNLLVSGVNIAIKSINEVIKLVNKILKIMKSLGIDLKIKINPIPVLKKVDLSKAIEDRIGMFKMEDDIVSVPKIAYVKNTTNDKNNKQLKPLNADDILERYHSIDFFSRNTNQYINKETTLDRITFDEVYDIITADELPNGVKLVRMSWSPFEHKAEITVKIPYIYAYNNLAETKSIPDGS